MIRHTTTRYQRVLKANHDRILMTGMGRRLQVGGSNLAGVLTPVVMPMTSHDGMQEHRDDSENCCRDLEHYSLTVQSHAAESLRNWSVASRPSPHPLPVLLSVSVARNLVVTRRASHILHAKAFDNTVRRLVDSDVFGEPQSSRLLRCRASDCPKKLQLRLVVLDRGVDKF